MLGKKDNQVIVYVKSQTGRDYIVKRDLLTNSDGSRSSIVMKPEAPNIAGWAFEVNDAIRFNQYGKPYVEVIEGHAKALKLDMTKKDWTITTLSTDEQKKIINLNIFKAHYGKLIGDLLQAIKPFLFIILGLTIGALVVSGVSAYFSYQANSLIQTAIMVK